MNTSPNSSEQYTVVARRYRPQAFGDLVGQNHVTQALSNAIKSNRVGHAYLFTGARGVGKTSSARIFAKCLNCQKGPTDDPCNECDVCESVSQGEDVDVLEIDGASNRGIDEIRQLRSNAAVRPSRAKFKIYIIDEVHMLTQQAFNALLKTLEEPPSHVKFIFCTTDPQKIPITVLSRCQRFDFSPVQTKEITQRLKEIAEAENIAADEGALQLLARRAGGSMRDSQSLLEQLFSFCGDSISIDEVHQLLGTADISRIADIAGAMVGQDSAAALEKVTAAMADGVDAGQLADQLMGYYRDMMAKRVGCNDETLLHCGPDDTEVLEQLAHQFGLETILTSVQILDNAVARMQNSLHIRTLLEVAVVRICNLEHLDLISDLATSLQGSKSKLPPRNRQASKSAAAAPKKNEVARNSSPDAALGAQAVDVKTPEAAAPSAGDRAGVQASSNAGDAASSAGVGAAAATVAVATAAAVSSSMGAGERESTAANESSLSDTTAQQDVGTANVNAADQPASVQPVSAAAATMSKAPEAYAESDSGTGSMAPESSETNGAANSGGATAVASPAQIGNVQKVWRQVLDTMGDMTADWASDFEKVELRGADQLVVTLMDSYNRDMCLRPQAIEKFESTLHQVSGQKIRVDFLVSKNKKEDASTKPVMTRNQQLLLLQERPLIKETMEIFDAEILNYYVGGKKKK